MTVERELARLRATLGQSQPVLLVLAGSNGAGKSTLYATHFAQAGLPFINADDARSIRAGRRATTRSRSSLAVEIAAQRLADRERSDRIARGESFITETVFSDPVGAKIRMLEEASTRGFRTVLVFVGISSPALSEARVLERVTARQGHDVPRDRLYARFPRTLLNLAKAIPLVDVTVLLDNDDDRRPFRFVARLERGRIRGHVGSIPPWVPRSVRTRLLRPATRKSAKHR